MPVPRRENDRIGLVAGLLSALARAMVEQSEFHRSGLVDFSVGSLGQSARSAARRLSAKSVTGRLQRQIERTLLADLCRGVDLGYAVVREAAQEAWPDLTTASDAAVAALREVSLLDNGLFKPEWHDADCDASAGVSPIVDLIGWRHTDGGIHFRQEPDGIVVWVAPLADEWVAKVGLVGFAICNSAVAAADKAVSSHAAIFGSKSAVP